MIEDDSNLVISLPGLTETELTGFKLEDYYTVEDYLPESVTKLFLYYQVGTEVEKINRFVYTYFDALSDTGGINGIFVYVAYIFVRVLSHNKAENHLVGKLYEGKDPLVPSSRSSLLEYLCCTCKSREDKLFAKARQLFAQETDIVHLLRTIRLFTAVTHRVVPKYEIERLKQ